VIDSPRRLRLNNAAEIVATTIEETLACLRGGALEEYPHQQPARAYSARDQATHRSGRAFPDGQSALNLAAASAWSTKRYVNIEMLKERQMRGAITA
jgi:hypothetical protein